MSPEQRTAHLLRIIVAQLQRISVRSGIGSERAFARPALVVAFSRYGVCRRGCSEDIDYQTFIIAFQREVHLPLVFRRPVPVNHVLSAVAVPVEFHLVPQLVDFVDKLLFSRHIGVHILAHAQKALHQEAAFNQVAAVVLLSERLHLPCRAVEPVRPYAVEAVSLCQIVHNLVQTLNACLARDETAVHSSYQSGNTETAAADCHGLRVVYTIFAVQVDALVGKSRSTVGTFPHIVEMHFLNEIEHRAVARKRVRTVNCLLCD